MLREKLQELVQSAVSKVAQPNSPVKILSATTDIKDGRGDFACAIAPQLAGQSGMSAQQLAQAIAKWLDGQPLEKVEVADNGFINLFVSKEALSMSMQVLLSEKWPAEKWSKKENCAVHTIHKEGTERLYLASHRLSAALRQLTEPRLNLLESRFDPPLLTGAQWLQIEGLYLRDMHMFVPAFDEELIGVQLASANKKLALFLDEFVGIAESSGQSKNGDAVGSYAQSLAMDINQSHFLDSLLLAEAKVRDARIGLILAAKRVFGACLGILNLAVPEKL